MVSTTPTINLPSWLSQCILEHDADRGKYDVVCRAFQFAHDLHRGQVRASGEAYIIHPIQVATMLRELAGDDPAMIAAGFLHDLLEDTEITPEEMENRFGAEVRHLVEGVTKLSKFSFESKTERQAESFRRMFLAMAQDIRVIVVKLADRLHNMRTLEYLSPEKQRRIARETMDIFAPLANRLGIWQFKWELEDLSFKYLQPEAYQEIRNLVATKRTEREEFIQQVVATLKESLAAIEIEHAEVTGRPKHLWGIYEKMQRQQKGFNEIYDVSAVRVIVQSVDHCYRALSVVHNQFRPIPGRFKDYIGLPKPNGYQSLHTAVIGSEGTPVEVQIRTDEMHRIAEYGVAAHWKYKESGSVTVKPEEERFTWLRSLLDWQEDLKDSQEYLQSLKENLFDSEVYVFTPKGDVIELPRGATPIDFAYRIHTEVGNRCTGAKVNGRLVTLDTELKNGDIIQILTAKNAHPNLDWINVVTTSSAKNRIRQWYKRSHRDENIARGRELLEKELGRPHLEGLLKSEQMLRIAERLNYQASDDLLAALGYGEVTVAAVYNKLQEKIREQQKKATEVSDSASITPQQVASLLPPTPRALPRNDQPILGVEGIVSHLARCCNPLPGDPIVGIVTRSSERGITIHCQSCSNVDKVNSEQLIPVQWNRNYISGKPTTYAVDVQVEVIDRVGVLKDILDRLVGERINIRKAQVKTYSTQTATIDLCIEVTNKDQLSHTIAQVEKISDVIRVRRLNRMNEASPGL